MSVLGGSDLLTVPIGKEQVKAEEYLSDVSPKHKPWDQHRGEADDVSLIYAGSRSPRHQRYAERVANCSWLLQFARDPPDKFGKQKLKLKTTWFCRVRHCPVCQWRRSRMWQARVYKALPLLIKDYPDTKFIFLTLTIRNCSIENLRLTLSVLGQGWKRLTELQTWPAIGWVRSVEITRGRDGSAHPHYHALLMIPPAYFQGNYLKLKEWRELWGQCLRIDYRPVVHIKVVCPEQQLPSGEMGPAPWNIWGAVVEILKYAVKPSDMIRDPEWFLQMIDQVHKTRAVAVGGVLKKYIREQKRENLMQEPGEEPSVEELERLFFGWKQPARRYRKLNYSHGA